MIYHDPLDTVAERVRCAHECPGGCPCKLRSDVQHTLHICSDPECVCHSRQRYEEAKQQRAAVRKALQTVEVLPW